MWSMPSGNVLERVRRVVVGPERIGVVEQIEIEQLGHDPSVLHTDAVEYGIC